MKPLVAIILVNYNGYSDTIECVKSIKKILYDNYTIVVVDNGSDIEDGEAINYLKKHTTYIKSNVNLGFSGGNNLGIRYCQDIFSPQYFLLINNDTVVKSDFLDKLIKTAEHNRDAGIICGKIYYYDEPQRIWFAGGIFDKRRGIADHINYNEIDKDFGEYEKEIEFATGCMLLLPKETIGRVGYLDEKYFLYAEDTDYSCRVRNSEMKILYNNSAVIYHKVSRSTKNGNLITYYMVRNNLYIINKYSTKHLNAYAGYFIQLIKSIIMRENRIGPTLKGISDFLRGKRGQINILRWRKK